MVSRGAHAVMMGGRSGTRQLIGLDLIRFAAAFMVMGLHLGAHTVLAPFTRSGWVGVQVFFVLSGFVIAYTAAEASAGKFFRNRVVRLMPSIWLCGSITALALWLHGGPPHLASLYVRTLALWPFGPWVDDVYWTLPIEVAFYALIFGLLALGAFKRVEWLFAALCLASGAYWIARLGSHLALLSPVATELATALLLRHGAFFALGGTLWAASRQGWTASRAAIALACVVIGAVEIVVDHAGYGHYRMFAAPALIWALFLAAIVFSIWRATLLQGWLGRHGEAIRLVGLATYPLYLLHNHIGVMLRDAMAPEVSPVAAALLAGVAAVAAAVAVAKWAEPAMQRPLRQVLTAVSSFPGRGRTPVKAPAD